MNSSVIIPFIFQHHLPLYHVNHLKYRDATVVVFFTIVIVVIVVVVATDAKPPLSSSSSSSSSGFLGSWRARVVVDNKSPKIRQRFASRIFDEAKTIFMAPSNEEEILGKQGPDVCSRRPYQPRVIGMDGLLNLPSPLSISRPTYIKCENWNKDCIFFIFIIIYE